MEKLEHKGIGEHGIIQGLQIDGVGCIVRFTNRIPGKPNRVESQCAVFVPGTIIKNGKLERMKRKKS